MVSNGRKLAFCAAIAMVHGVLSQTPRPVILDTDYGPFIDDVFALGLIANSVDLLDLKFVLTTSEDRELSAKCVSKHLALAGRTDVKVGVGNDFPPYDKRGSVCAIPGFVGFALRDECINATDPIIEDGMTAMTDMLMASDRDDWLYIQVAGMTSVQKLIEGYPEAAAKIDTLIVMGGNWCGGFEPYPGVPAPTDETNIGCDPIAANFVVNQDTSPFKNIIYTPVVVASEIGGDDYKVFVDAADSGANKGAAATLDFYKAWSAAGRANNQTLVHAEAMAYDPETESTPQFDACAIMMAIELLNGCEDRLVLEDVPAVHFVQVEEVQGPLPRSAFSLLPEGFTLDELPFGCPALTNYTFDPSNTTANERAVKIALGYKDEAAKKSFYSEMAQRMAGNIPSSCEPGAAPSAAPPAASPSTSGSNSLMNGQVFLWTAAISLVISFMMAG